METCLKIRSPIGSIQFALNVSVGHDLRARARMCRRQTCSVHVLLIIGGQAAVRRRSDVPTCCAPCPRWSLESTLLPRGRKLQGISLAAAVPDQSDLLTRATRNTPETAVLLRKLMRCLQTRAPPRGSTVHIFGGMAHNVSAVSDVP